MNDQDEKLLCYVRKRVGYGPVRKISAISDKAGLFEGDGHLSTCNYYE